MLTKNRGRRSYLLVLAFVTGLTVMAVEISASRLLAPYFGSSTFVWTSIIGIIMLALSLGYWWGGKLVDRKPDLPVLLRILLVACLILFVLPFVVKPLVNATMGGLLDMQSASAIIFIGSMVSASLLFLPPVLLLGMTSPFIIKLITDLDPKQVGKDAGLVFSISTIGSLLGTFLPVLVFIPTVGTRRTIIIFTSVLFLTVLAGFWRWNKRMVLLGLLIVPLLIIKLPAIKQTTGAIAEDESAYQYFQVIDQGNIRYLSINAGLSMYSIINKDGRPLTGYYYDNYNLLPYLDGNGARQDILILGLAGGTISTQLNHFFAQNHDLHIDGVEVDKKLINNGNQYFGMANPSLTIHNIDGRNFLSTNQKKYDAVVVDVYADQLYIPFHMATQEFFTLVRDHLKPDGVVAMNINATADDSKLLKNITNTIALTYNNVEQIKVNADDWNYMVIASNKSLDFGSLAQVDKNAELAPVIKTALSNHKEIAYDKNFGQLTDDKAPTEYLTDWMVLDYAFKNRNDS